LTEHLNGGILDDRSLLADGRNETETQTLREWTTTWTATVPYRDRHGSSASSNTYSSTTSASQYSQITSSSPSTYSGSERDVSDGTLASLLETDCEQWHYQTQQGSQSYAPVSPTLPGFPYYQPQSPLYEGASSPLFTSPVAQYPVTQSPSTVIYTSNVVASTQVYIPPQPVYAYHVPYMSNTFSPSSAPVSPTSPTSPPLIKTEARKIIITQLPHGITSSTLRELLTKTISNSKHATPFSSSSVQSIEIATHVDGKAKGHAFAVFQTHTIAKTVVQAIDGLQFQGRVLSARFAKEGAEPSSRYCSGVREEQVVASSAELFQLSALGAQWWGFGGESKANPRISEQKMEGGVEERHSESKPHNERKESSGETMTIINGGVATQKSPRPMSAPVVVDGSSSSGSQGKDRKHPS
jgi:hypothetical protein